MPAHASPVNAKVTSITVAFNPNPERLAEQVRALRGEVGEIVIVDNGSETAVARLPQLAGLPIRVLPLAENTGVAHGFNAGVAVARERGAEYVLLLDDDSVPTPGMVEELIAACRGRSHEDGAPAVAAVGPRVQDSRDPHDYPFIRLGWTHNRHVRCGTTPGEVVACDFLISSGSLVPMEAFTTVGEFDEGLFIDSVDLEWCCRARSRGLALYGVCAARLDHRLGDRRQAVLNIVELVVHSPERVYYMTRNRFLLYRRSYMPLKWKLKDMLRWLAKFSATVLLIAPRAEYARMTLRAIRDALLGRSGKLEAR
jgi:rhamnosyltransferase